MATTMRTADLELVEPGPGTQRVAVLDAPGRIRVAHAAIPEPGLGQIRVKIAYVGVCGSDIETYRGHRAPEFVSFPARLGHEVAGVIDKVGPGVQGIRAGDRVTCRYVWGAFAEYIVCLPMNVMVVPPQIPMEEVSLLEVLPGILNAVERAAIGPSTTVLVTGQGVSGLVLTQVLRLYSPKVLAVTDLRDRNLELARAYGATHTYKLDSARAATRSRTHGDFRDGFDVVIPCLLDGEGMIDAVDACAFGGRIVMYGCIGPCHEPFDFFRIHRKRLDILSTEPRRDVDMRRLFHEGVRLMCDGLIDTHSMITHIVPLTEIDRAFALRDGKSEDAIHVLVNCEA